MNATLTKLTRLGGEPAAADGPLIDAFLAGDQAAFAALVRRHAALVFATCRRVLRHHQDAEDAFQATFLVLARRAADVWPREAVGSWLFGVAHRVALKARAVRSRRLSREEPLEEAAAGGAPPDFDLAELVHRAVCKLPEVYRAAVVACDLQGLSRKEAAARLGWTEGTLSGRLARARDLLAARLRRHGVSLPAGGLAATFATGEAVSAAVLQNTLELATGTAASAPIAALTEGVVRSMALFQLKTAVAAVMTACAIGFGVFAAAGAGQGDGPGAGTKATPGTTAPAGAAAEPPAKPPLPAAALKRPRPELARRELEVLLQEIDLAAVSGKVDKELLDRLRGRLRLIDRLLDPDDLVIDPKQPASTVTDRDRLQGRWRVVALTEDGKATPTDPKEPWVVEVTSRIIRMPYREAGGKWKQREYVFDVNEVPSPRTIGLIAPNEPVGSGIYEFTLPSAMCASCHDHPFAEKGKPPLPSEVLGVCAPALKDHTRAPHLGVRLALTADGSRPAGFGGKGVIVFTLARAGAPDAEQDKLIEAQKRLEAALKAAKTDDDRRKLEAELLAYRRRLAALHAVKSAEAELERARAQFQQSQAQLEAAKAQLDDAAKNLKLAQDKLDALKKAGTAKPPAGGGFPGQEFTIHIRGLRAPEKVLTVIANGKQTILDAIKYADAADDIAIKPDAVTIWLLRGNTVLPVDLAAITKDGATKTNYLLRAGDKLFVQAKAEK